MKLPVMLYFTLYGKVHNQEKAVKVRLLKSSQVKQRKLQCNRNTLTHKWETVWTCQHHRSWACEGEMKLTNCRVWLGGMFTKLGESERYFKENMGNLLLSVYINNNKKRIPKFVHIFYFDTWKVYWKKSQFEGKCYICSFVHVGLKVRVKNSYRRIQLLVEEYVAIHRITTSRVFESMLLWKNEGAQWKYLQTTYVYPLAIILLWFHYLYFMNIFPLCIS